MRNGAFFSYRSVHLDARMISLMSVFISCNKLHATGALFHIVACILMHDRTTHGTLFNPFGYWRFRATGSVISYCSVHLDARMIALTSVFIRATSCTLRERMISPRCGMKYSDFCACFFVQQVARYDSFIFKTFDGARFTACADNRLIWKARVRKRAPSKRARYGDQVENVNIFVCNYST